MTVYYATPYMVGGSYTHGGDREVHHDSIPDHVTKLWEIDPAEPGDTMPWIKGDDGYWTPAEPGYDVLTLSSEELLEEFGPVSDDEADAAIGLDALETRVRLAELEVRP